MTEALVILALVCFIAAFPIGCALLAWGVVTAIRNLYHHH